MPSQSTSRIEHRVYVCDIHGETKNVVGMGSGPPWCVECRKPVDVVMLVPAGPRPGEMHPVDQAFYDLTVKERDYERVKCDRLEAELAAEREALDSAVLHRISELAREGRDYGNKAVADHMGVAVQTVKRTRERLRAGGFDV